MKSVLDYIKWIYNLDIAEYLSVRNKNGIAEYISSAVESKYLKEPIEKEITVIITDMMCCFGVIKSRHTSYIIGPVLNTPADGKSITDYALDFSLPASMLDELEEYIKALPVIELVHFSKVLCMINFIINGNHISPEQIYMSGVNRTNIVLGFEEETPPSPKDYTGYFNIEKKLMSLIKTGDTKNLVETMLQLNTNFNPSGDSVNFMRTTFITITTLACRTAIEGGLDMNRAFTMCDSFIDMLQTHYKTEDMFSLLVKVVLDYTNAVSGAAMPDNLSPISEKCIKYINKNLNTHLSVRKIAENLCVSPNYLSALFKKEMGIGIIDYIQRRKIDEAKELLKNHELSVLDISEYLCFSSQSYFQNVFRKITGMTPKAYLKTLK